MLVNITRHFNIAVRRQINHPNAGKQGGPNQYIEGGPLLLLKPKF
jgi:hypothetical protein